MPAKRTMDVETPDAQLASFLERFDPSVQQRMHSVRAALRTRFPTANELAYDYTTHVLIAYSPTTHGIHGIVSVDARPEGVRLYFNQASHLPDPGKLLKGTGKQARYIELESEQRLTDPDVEALIGAAVAASTMPQPATGKGALSIRGAAAKKPSREMMISDADL